MTDVLTGKERTHGHRVERPCEDAGRDWRDAFTSQGMPKIPNNH